MSYCDSKKYADFIDSTVHSEFFNFIANIVKNGMSSSTYSTRADIIMQYLEPDVHPLEYDTKLAVCDTTVGRIISTFFNDFPTIREEVICNSNVCPTTSINISFITYQTNLKIGTSQLQKYLNDRTKSLDNQICVNMDCNGIKRVQSLLSNKHLFIDVLCWEGNC